MQQHKPVKTVALEAMLPLIEDAFSRGQDVRLPVTGISMRPTLDNGDVVTLQPACAPFARGDVLLYRRPTGQFVLHRVVQVHTDTIDFCGDGQVVIEKGVPTAGVIGKVVGCVHDNREWDAAYLHKMGQKQLRSRPLRRLGSMARALLRKWRLKKGGTA